MARCLLYPLPTQIVPDDTVQRLAELPTSIVSDRLLRTGGARGIMPIPGSPSDGRVAGRALTVRVRAGDNVVLQKAIDLAAVGDVLVVDAGGYLDQAVVGEISYRHAVQRGVAAFVIDGAVRDAVDLAAGPIPVAARGTCHVGPFTDAPGEIGGPIAVGGEAVRTGDVVVIDADGVAFVPRELAGEVAESGARQHADEDDKLAQASAGTLDRSWIDGRLELVQLDGTTTTPLVADPARAS